MPNSRARLRSLRNEVSDGDGADVVEHAGGVLEVDLGDHPGTDDTNPKCTAVRTHALSSPLLLRIRGATSSSGLGDVHLVLGVIVHSRDALILWRSP
jgi:hypothetical protein